MSITSATPSGSPEFLSSQVTAARRFYLNLKPRSARTLTVVCGGSEDCAADYVIERSTFPFWSVEFVAAGAGELTLAGKTHGLRAGTVFAYGPQVPHLIRTAREPRLVKYFVDFIGDPSVQLLRACGLKPGAVTQVAAVGDVRDAFDTLVRLGAQHDTRTERTCALQLEVLLHTIARSRQFSTVCDRRSRTTFERVREFMDSQFLDVSSVEEVARACHLDSSHMSRLVRRFHSESPLRYLQRRRMQWAADRLQSSTLFVREVADELNMDAFQFSRTFKRMHGLSPTEFLATRAGDSPKIDRPKAETFADAAAGTRRLRLIASAEKGTISGRNASALRIDHGESARAAGG
jgi:AraC-like DNA-binding protein